MLLLFFEHNDIETEVTVLELIFELTLFQIMLIQLRNFNDTRTVLTNSQHLALFYTMNIIHVIVLKLRVLSPTVIAHGPMLLIDGFG